MIATLIVTCGSVSLAWSANWESDLEAARAIALQQNKLLLIHFSTPDCGPCKVVEKKVFPAPQVDQAIRENFVPLKVNAYQDTVLRDFFNVRQWPTDVIATVDGKALHTMVTPQDPRKYATALTQLANTHRKLPPSTADNSQQPFAQTQQHTNYDRAPWSNKIAAPDISENTARARRPGVDLQASRPAPMGGPIMPSPSKNVPPASNGQWPSRGKGISGLQQPVPAEISNRFAANQPFNSQATPPLAQSEIRNPYAQPRPSAPTSSIASNASPVAQQQPGWGHSTQQQGTPPTGSYNSPPPTGSTPSANQTVTAEPQSFGLDGRCPVTLVTQKKWVKGNPQWGAIHRGQTYLFAGPEEQQRFMADPDQFSPVLAGMDVVALAANGSVVQGRRGFGVLYDDDGPTGPRPNRIYLFDSSATRDRFESNPEAYVQPVMQALRANQLQTLVR